MITTIGDFKAKTGTAKNEYPESIGKYGKSRWYVPSGRYQRT